MCTKNGKYFSKEDTKGGKWSIDDGSDHQKKGHFCKYHT